MYFNIEKGERGAWLSTKRRFFEITFCSNVSTLLSMIVSAKGIGGSEKRVTKGNYHAKRRELYTFVLKTGSLYNAIPAF